MHLYIQPAPPPVSEGEEGQAVKRNKATSSRHLRLRRGDYSARLLLDVQPSALAVLLPTMLPNLSKAEIDEIQGGTAQEQQRDRGRETAAAAPPSEAAAKTAAYGVPTDHYERDSDKKKSAASADDDRDKSNNFDEKTEKFLLCIRGYQGGVKSVTTVRFYNQKLLEEDHERDSNKKKSAASARDNSNDSEGRKFILCIQGVQGGVKSVHVLLESSLRRSNEEQADVTAAAFMSGGDSSDGAKKPEPVNMARTNPPYSFSKKMRPFLLGKIGLDFIPQMQKEWDALSSTQKHLWESMSLLDLERKSWNALRTISTKSIQVMMDKQKASLSKKQPPIQAQAAEKDKNNDTNNASELSTARLPSSKKHPPAYSLSTASTAPLSATTATAATASSAAGSHEALTRRSTAALSRGRAATTNNSNGGGEKEGQASLRHQQQGSSANKKRRMADDTSVPPSQPSPPKRRAVSQQETGNGDGGVPGRLFRTAIQLVGWPYGGFGGAAAVGTDDDGDAAESQHQHAGTNDGGAAATGRGAGTTGPDEGAMGEGSNEGVARKEDEVDNGHYGQEAAHRRTGRTMSAQEARPDGNGGEIEKLRQELDSMRGELQGVQGRLRETEANLEALRRANGEPKEEALEDDDDDDNNNGGGAAAEANHAGAPDHGNDGGGADPHGNDGDDDAGFSANQANGDEEDDGLHVDQGNDDKEEGNQRAAAAALAPGQGSGVPDSGNDGGGAESQESGGEEDDEGGRQEYADEVSPPSRGDEDEEESEDDEDDDSNGGPRGAPLESDTEDDVDVEDEEIPANDDDEEEEEEEDAVDAPDHGNDGGGAAAGGAPPRRPPRFKTLADKEDHEYYFQCPYPGCPFIATFDDETLEKAKHGPLTRDDFSWSPHDDMCVDNSQRASAAVKQLGPLRVTLKFRHAKDYHGHEVLPADALLFEDGRRRRRRTRA